MGIRVQVAALPSAVRLPFIGVGAGGGAAVDNWGRGGDDVQAGVSGGADGVGGAATVGIGRTAAAA